MAKSADQLEEAIAIYDLYLKSPTSALKLLSKLINEHQGSTKLNYLNLMHLLQKRLHSKVKDISGQ